MALEMLRASFQGISVWEGRLELKAAFERKFPFYLKQSLTVVLMDVDPEHVLTAPFLGSLKVLSTMPELEINEFAHDVKFQALVENIGRFASMHERETNRPFPFAVGDKVNVVYQRFPNQSASLTLKNY
jgi:hypothetical protein